ncbi:hypothetical protein C0J52_09837, partial [Blattella germanica]
FNFICIKLHKLDLWKANLPTIQRILDLISSGAEMLWKVSIPRETHVFLGRRCPRWTCLWGNDEYVRSCAHKNSRGSAPSLINLPGIEYPYHRTIRVQKLNSSGMEQTECYQYTCEYFDRDVVLKECKIQEVDFIVVGAGTGGSVVAGRLARAHEHSEVALLEAGGPYPTGSMFPGSYSAYAKPESPINWNFVIEKQKHACLGYKNGTCLYPRGNPYDYDRWASKGLKGWSYDDVLPYFKVSENNLQIGEKYSQTYHGNIGLVPVSQFRDQPKMIEKMLRAAEEMQFSTNHDLNGDDQIGFTIAQATTYNGTRVTKVLLDSNCKAIGVEYIKNKKKMHLYARKEVILSAGAIQSPQILLLSGIGPKEHLKDIGVPVIKHLPMVGKNMQNHVAYTVKFKLKDKCLDDLLNNDSLYEFLRYREGPMTSTGLSQRYISLIPTLLHPKSRGIISLRSKNPMDPPRIAFNYLEDEDDINSLINAIHFVLKMAKTSALKDSIELDNKPETFCENEKHTERYWECAIRYWTNPENHQTGSCSMGTNEETSVVDTELRVHGIGHLRVIDASVIPITISGNINAPIMMVAEKGADMILTYWAHEDHHQQTLEWFAMPTHGMEDVQEEMLSFSSQLLGMVWSYSNNYFFVVLIIHSDNLAKAITILILAAIGAHGYLRQRAETQYFDTLLKQPKCARALNEKSSLPHTCGTSYTGSGSFMVTVEEILQRQCDLVDPIRGQENNLNLQEDQTVDFIVVGAGTAGSIVAGRLATTTQQWQVALLEAGGPYPTGAMFPGSYFSYAKADSGFNWDFLLEPQEYACKGQANGQCHWPRGKALGGTGVLHGMMYMRANPWDYDRWASLGISGWSWKEVLPYFMMSENNTQVGSVYSSEFHSTQGPVVISQFRDHPTFAEKILAGGGELGYNYGTDLNGKSQLGFTLAQATQFNGSRLSMYNSYIAPLVANKQSNLIVSPWSYVTKILFSDDQKKAVGVEYVKNNATHRVYARKEVILSAGTIQSPQIMLLSGLGPKADLEKLNIKVVQDMPLVGKNLQNHVSYSIRFKVNEDHYEERLNDDSLYAYITQRQGPLTSTGMSQTTGFVRVNELDGSPNSVPQVQMFFEGYLANCSTDGLTTGHCGELRYITMTPTLLRPKSAGTLTLRSANPMDPPVINANYLASAEERQTLVDAIYFTLKLAKTNALKDYVTLEIPPTTNCTAEFGSYDYWYCAIQYWNNPENHQIGTCKMGNGVETSVVNPELKVHGISGLRVVDGAVIPEQVSGNANAPIMMVAEKAILLLAAIGAHGYISQRVELQYFDTLLKQSKCPRALNEVSSLPRTCGAGYTGTASYMSDVEELLQRQCDLVDPIRGQENNLNLQEDQTVDFIVVGAGTAGSIVTGRLATTTQQWQVALLEAGGPYPTGAMFPGSYFSYAKADSGFNWDFLLEPQEYACKGQANGQCHWPRGKALGGTGVLHGMMYMRANPWDYDRWASLGVSGWSWKEVLPYFMMSENNTQVGPVYSQDFHSTQGPVVISQFRDHPRIAEKILAGGGELGYNYGNDLNGKSQLGFTLAQATQFNGSRLSMYNSYIAPLVTKILFSDDQKKAVGVEYVKNNATHRVYARKEVILSAGTIQSPQIMLLSGLGPKADLEKLNIKVVQDMPLVGKNLQNHVSFSIRFKVNESQYVERLNDESLYAYLTERQGPLTSTGLSQTTGFVRVNELDGSPSTVPQVQMFFEGYLANCSTDGLPSGHCGEVSFTLKLAKTNALKDIVTLEIPPTTNCKAEFGSYDYWYCAIQYWNNPENHQIGTCKMGTGVETSVVNSELKVHGISGLRVVDGAVIPEQVSGNANAPIMMVGEKGADMIKKTWASA